MSLKSKSYLNISKDYSRINCQNILSLQVSVERNEVSLTSLKNILTEADNGQDSCYNSKLNESWGPIITYILNLTHVTNLINPGLDSRYNKKLYALILANVTDQNFWT